MVRLEVVVCADVHSTSLAPELFSCFFVTFLNGRLTSSKIYKEEENDLGSVMTTFVVNNTSIYIS